MEKIKCGQCGLVSWQGAVSCARCKGLLGTGVNTFENETATATKGGVSLVVVGLAVFALACIGFGVYKAFAPVQPAVQQPQAQVQNTPEVMDPQKVGQMLSEQQKKDPVSAELMRDPWDNSTEAGRKRNQEMMQKAVKIPKVQTFPQVPPGGFGPPGAGVPLHTH